jgi:hypothetical protein
MSAYIRCDRCLLLLGLWWDGQSETEKALQWFGRKEVIADYE